MLNQVPLRSSGIGILVGWRVDADDAEQCVQVPRRSDPFVRRWYLRYPLSYEHVAELVAERGIQVDASCIWRWVQAYAPELDKRSRPQSEADQQEPSRR